MAWVETASGAFRARHDSRSAAAAEHVLQTLEQVAEDLADLFPRVPSEVTIVLHGGTAGLSFAAPLLPLHWLATDPAARRYVVGWSGAREIHMLAPDAQLTRASQVPGSREMLERSASCLFARQVVVASNRDLARVMPLLRARRAARWAWLLDGAARWFGGQTAHARPAIARRLRDGPAPRFPPDRRDAPLLGGTVIDLLVREQGERAAARLACRLDPAGPRAALARAFGGRPLSRTEDAWRSHLQRLAGAA